MSNQETKPHEADPLDMLGLGEPEQSEEPKGESPIEQIPEIPEPPKVEPKEEPKEEIEINPIEKEFIERGLDKRFKGGVEKAFDYIPQADKYITTLEQERSELRRQLAEIQAQRSARQETPIDTDKFMEDPAGTIKKLREELRQEVQQELSNTRNAIQGDVEMLKAQTFMDNTKDFANYREDMQRELMMHPELEGLPLSKAMKIVYKMAKASRIPDIVEDATKKTRGDNPNRDRAQSSAGGLTQRTAGLTPDKLASMSDAELLKLMREPG